MERRNGINIMWSLLRLLGHLKYIIIFAVLGGCLGNASAIAVMVFGATSVVKIFEPTGISVSLNYLICFTIVSGIIRGLLRFLEQYSNHFIAFKLLAKLRDEIFGKLRILAPAKLEGKQKGAIIAMLTADIETLEVFYAHTISPILIAIIMNGGVSILISYLTNVWMGAVAFGAYFLIGVCVPFSSSYMLKKDGVEYRKQFADSSSYFMDSIKGITDILLNNQQNARNKELERQSAFMNRKSRSMKRKSACVNSITNLLVSVSVLVLCFLTTMLVSNREVTVAHAIITVVLFSSSFGPVLALAALPTNLTQTFAAGNHVLDFMEENPVVVENKHGKNTVFQTIQVEDISFGYEEKQVLNNVSFQISKGEIVGVVGPSGCGKSTLLKLLLRFYDPCKGRILYDGIHLKDIRTDALHKNVVMVSQDTYIFHDTILNNLLVANPQASMKEVEEACKKASIHKFISGLEYGYQTEAGLLGDTLSAGEKQRIGLARAFLSGAKIILLDEVTSNVDAINEGIILSSIKETAGEYTYVLVSHKESTVNICNRIIRV